MKKQSAITLIALIITIIIMMILVGVTVTVALNGGLFRTANEAAIKKEIARMQEELFLIRAELKMKNPSSTMPNVGEVLAEGAGIELVEVEVSENAEIISNVDNIPQGSCYKLIPQSLNVSTKRGTGEMEDLFIVDQKFNVYYILKADNLQPGSIGEFRDGVSTPNLKGFKIKSSNNKDSNKVSVRYVTYSETGEPIIGDTVDNEPPGDWYEYTNSENPNENRWANIAVIGNEDISYFTWIPRYEYRTYKEGNVDKVEINYIPREQTTPTEGYTIPEAFIWDKTDDGGGITHLAGFWVSKYKLTAQDNSSMDFTYKTTGTSIEITETLTSSTDSMKYEFYIAKLGEELQEKEENSIGKYKFTGLTNGETYSVLIKAYKVDESGNVKSFVGEKIKNICVYTPGKPDLTGFNSDITKYVTWDSEGNEIVGNNISGEAPDNWYNYETNSWANVKVENGDDISYFTWVPRYEYRKYKYNNTEKMEIDFIPPDKTPTPGFTIPEAFTWDMTDDDGEKVNLSGFWVSKYKLSNN